ncbi:hypothetical protein ACIBEA_38860 [Streptomyces sp. NPDC051555]|uniref:hypothetical protein n=1 Tax=Streptomyces sp. NPDC051555 TaxID=3365657 RepID=UPI0037B27396
MTYLLIDDGRILSAYSSLAAARAAEAQGAGPSTEPGPLLGTEPAWWYRNRPADGTAKLGIVRTQATALGIRFELRLCQAPAGTCSHHPCPDYLAWAVNSSYSLLAKLAVFVPAAWLWCGPRSHDPRGDATTFRAEAQALTVRLTAELRPPLRTVTGPPSDIRTLSEREQAAQGQVLRFLARHFGSGPKIPPAVQIRPVLDGQQLHLTFQPPAPDIAALCGTWLPGPQTTGAGAGGGDVLPCDQCFGRAPIVPVPVLTEAEHDAWTDFLRAQSPPRPTPPH